MGNCYNKDNDHDIPIFIDKPKKKKLKFFSKRFDCYVEIKMTPTELNCDI